MSKGKYQKNGRKSVALMLALVLVVGGVVGGTIAWLTDSTDEVENTFTASDINITLTESDNLDLKMIPGWTITKDPKVTLEANSEACYVFVKIDEDLGAWSDNKVKGDSGDEVNPVFKDYLNYSVNTDWTAGDGESIDEGGNGVPVGVYYRKVETNEAKAGASWYVIQGDATNANGIVTVSENVTKQMMDEIDEETEAKPTLTFTAYAVQLYKSNGVEFTAEEAWARAADLNTTP